MKPGFSRFPLSIEVIGLREGLVAQGYESVGVQVTFRAPHSVWEQLVPENVHAASGFDGKERGRIFRSDSHPDRYFAGAGGIRGAGEGGYPHRPAGLALDGRARPAGRQPRPGFPGRHAGCLARKRFGIRTGVGRGPDRADCRHGGCRGNAKRDGSKRRIDPAGYGRDRRRGRYDRPGIGFRFRSGPAAWRIPRPGGEGPAAGRGEKRLPADRIDHQSAGGDPVFRRSGCDPGPARLCGNPAAGYFRRVGRHHQVAFPGPAGRASRWWGIR